VPSRASSPSVEDIFITGDASGEPSALRESRRSARRRAPCVLLWLQRDPRSCVDHGRRSEGAASDVIVEKALKVGRLRGQRRARRQYDRRTPP